MIPDFYFIILQWSMSWNIYVHPHNIKAWHLTWNPRNILQQHPFQAISNFFCLLNDSCITQLSKKLTAQNFKWGKDDCILSTVRKYLEHGCEGENMEGEYPGHIHLQSLSGCEKSIKGKAKILLYLHIWTS